MSDLLLPRLFPHHQAASVVYLHTGLRPSISGTPPGAEFSQIDAHDPGYQLDTPATLPAAEAPETRQHAAQTQEDARRVTQAEVDAYTWFGRAAITLGDKTAGLNRSGVMGELNRTFGTWPGPGASWMQLLLLACRLWGNVHSTRQAAEFNIGIRGAVREIGRRAVLYYRTGKSSGSRVQHTPSVPQASTTGTLIVNPDTIG